jgi:alginate O-acetyltransferase complex protein AlgI
MTFNSVAFAIFLTVVFSLYWFITNNSLKAQNILLLFASYFFYGWWDWRFMVLLVCLSVLNYFIAIRIDKNELKKRRKMWLLAALFINIGILGVFKYFNFFIDSFIDLISFTGYNLAKSSIKIILPLGISFYVFLSLSYILDIYKKSLIANRNIVEVLLSFSFFPIILAGPIQRPSTLMPQFAKRREFNYAQAADGLRQILWGLFVKVVIADNLAFYVNDVFLNYSSYSGSLLLIGAVFYSIQIYADFSAYSDMAIGTAKLFGFNLMRNFAYPYFSRDITEFWKRWHISLTSWFRDYVFFPISFSVSWRIRTEKVLLIKTDLFIYITASLITWFLTGLWHGANYTFIIWGMIHGLFLIIYRWQIKPRKRVFKKMGINNNSKAVVLIESIITLIIVVIAWIFFRSDNIGHAVRFIDRMLSWSLFSIPHFTYSRMMFLVITILTVVFIAIEWAGRKEQYAISGIGVKFPVIARWAVYYMLIFVIFFFAGSGQKFIYFQF